LLDCGCSAFRFSFGFNFGFGFGSRVSVSVSVARYPGIPLRRWPGGAASLVSVTVSHAAAAARWSQFASPAMMPHLSQFIRQAKRNNENKSAVG